ncbi:MAG: hypothetical protein P8L85_00450 [Rubripirellula sp.]|nr:hypothetical protein [Rubripirellula sp.]
MSVEITLTSTLWNCGRTVIAMASLSVAVFGLQLQAQSPLRQAARWAGYGWGDGYHACESSEYRFGENLPPRLPARQGIGHHLHKQGKYKQRFGATYYDHFDAGSHHFQSPAANCDGACDATLIQEPNHLLSPEIDGPPITQSPITQSPSLPPALQSDPFSTMANLALTKDKKQPIRPTPPPREQSTDQAPAYVRFFENVEGEITPAVGQNASDLIAEATTPQSTIPGQPQLSTTSPAAAKVPSLTSDPRVPASIVHSMPTRIGGGSPAADAKSEQNRPAIVLDMTLPELTSMLASPRTTPASSPGIDASNATAKSRASLQPHSHALPATNRAAATSTASVTPPRKAASSLKMPSQPTDTNGPLQAIPYAPGPYQILAKNAAVAAPPNATESAIQATVNQPGSSLPPGGITFPTAQQPAFQAAQPAPPTRSRRAAVTTISPAASSQSPAAGDRSPLDRQPPSYAREAPKPTRLGDHSDRKPRQIKSPRQASRQLTAPVSDGIQLNPLTNRGTLDNSHRQSSPEMTIQQTILR